MEERHLGVTRTARYFLLGTPAPVPAVRELWIVLHGYGQLAGKFLEEFRPLAAPHRLLVAPEALSRFYLHPPARSGHARSPVGASWMTREDRGAEIADYVAYLDALLAELHRALAPVPPMGTRGRVAADLAVHVLGFSQGTATASRWLALGAVRADRLVLWGGLVPDDLDLAGCWERLAVARPVYVTGEGDEYAGPAQVHAQAERLRRYGIRAETVVFPGGHHLDAAVLRRIAEG